MSKEQITSLAQPPAKKLPLLLKVLAVFLIIVGAVSVPQIILMAFGIPVLLDDLSQQYGTLSVVIILSEMILTLGSGVIYVLLGINMLRDHRRHARQYIEIAIVLSIGQFICDLMLVGLSALDIWFVVRITLAVILMVYIDPSLSEERQLQRKLRDLETKERAEEGTLGRDKTGKGFIELDFFNLFWIFVVASFLGLIIETVYHMVVVEPGVYQNRTGLLWGPFSPIYGLGAVLMTVALNRFHKANIVVIFLVSAVIGGVFEYLVSWFLQFAFGIMAWDYSGTFLSIDGRTNGQFMFMWGLLGCVWIKLILPYLLKLVNMIPWKLRYSLTTVCAVLMIFDAAMTLLAFDCWYQRVAGDPVQNAIEQFMADHFNNDYMENRFQTMSIDPSRTTRAN